jgi:hypothetical protein
MHRRRHVVGGKNFEINQAKLKEGFYDPLGIIELPARY